MAIYDERLRPKYINAAEQYELRTGNFWPPLVNYGQLATNIDLFWLALYEKNRNAEKIRLDSIYGLYEIWESGRGYSPLKLVTLFHASAKYSKLVTATYAGKDSYFMFNAVECEKLRIPHQPGLEP